mmetsp:Transcript_2979/g.4722  ORF Transcript_2979/g.4722 Transcript_2979/m.4722 type:complete len:424 (-) Transcript_2979:420-1691(-)
MKKKSRGNGLIAGTVAVVVVAIGVAGGKGFFPGSLGPSLRSLVQAVAVFGTDVTQFVLGIVVGSPSLVVAFRVVVGAAKSAASAVHFRCLPVLAGVAVGDKVNQIHTRITNVVSISVKVVTIQQQNAQVLQVGQFNGDGAREFVAVQQQVVQTEHESEPGWDAASKVVSVQIQHLKAAQFSERIGQRTNHVVSFHGQILQILHAAVVKHGHFRKVISRGSQVSHVRQLENGVWDGSRQHVHGNVKVLQVVQESNAVRYRTSNFVAMNVEVLQAVVRYNVVRETSEKHVAVQVKHSKVTVVEQSGRNRSIQKIVRNIQFLDLGPQVVSSKLSSQLVVFQVQGFQVFQAFDTVDVSGKTKSVQTQNTKIREFGDGSGDGGVEVITAQRKSSEGTHVSKPIRDGSPNASLHQSKGLEFLQILNPDR